MQLRGAAPALLSGFSGGEEVTQHKISIAIARAPTHLIVFSAGLDMRFEAPKLDAQCDASLHPDIITDGRFYGDTDLRVRWEMLEHLFRNGAVYESDAE